MSGFGPATNTFKKKNKNKGPARVHGRQEPPAGDCPPARKHAAGLRSPKGPSGRSQGPGKGRPGRTPAPTGGPSPRRSRHAGASRGGPDVSQPAGRGCGADAGAPRRGTKKRGRSASSSRTAESSGSGAAGCPASGARQPSGGGDDTVKVVVRIRPSTAIDERTGDPASCLRQLSEDSLAVVDMPERAQFSYDAVAGPEVDQEAIFQSAGRPVVENCLAGYNSCVFAYGQTGSGKTHTMLGDLPDEVGASWLPPTAGLMPRIFQHLFGQIAARQAADPGVEYTCNCSLLEIYNEMITDLLAPPGGGTNLQVREDVSTGVYVEGLTVETVDSAQGAMDMLRRGSVNRRVGETCMNFGSSRSHCVLTCVIESKSTDGNGFTNVLFSRLNLVDLAGSERQKTSGTTGGRLREASSINRSLSTLGLVIMSLMEVQQRGRRTKHVPYRDSKLTFLLQDSLGGNSKTVMIANVSPAPANMHETISTLRFARRAKFIKNRAVVNEDLTADAALLKQEIARLNQEVARFRKICEDALGSADQPCPSGRHAAPPSCPDSGCSSSRSGREKSPRSDRSARSARSAKSGRTNRSDVASRDGWGAQRAYDLEELRSRAEVAASQAVSAASMQIEQAMARAEEARRQDLQMRAEQDSSDIRDLQDQLASLAAKRAASWEERDRLQTTVEQNMALQGDNQRLQKELVQAGEIEAGLKSEMAVLEEQIAAKTGVEEAAREACQEASWAKDKLESVAHEKETIEAQLRLARQETKDLHLRNRELEEQMERCEQLAKAGRGPAAGCQGMDSEEEGEPCSCGMEIVRLEGLYTEEKEKTYRLMRELEILSLQQDEEFRSEFGSCKDQLVTLLKKLEDATNELNHLKHTLVERDAEALDLQEFVEATWAQLSEFAAHRELLEDYLREQLQEKEELVNKVRSLEGELDGVRRAAQEGLPEGRCSLIESLQSELHSLRQENSRLTCRMEGRSSEVAHLRAELAALRACSRAQSPQVCVGKPTDPGAAVTAHDVGHQAFGGRSPLSPTLWAASEELQRSMAQARSLVAQCTGSAFSDEMDLDFEECETGMQKGGCVSGDGLGHQPACEVTCL